MGRKHLRQKLPLAGGHHPFLPCPVYVSSIGAVPRALKGKMRDPAKAQLGHAM
jgi:hypothetical protein